MSHSFNHFTVFAALVHILTQHGAIWAPFTVEPVPEEREVNTAADYRASIVDCLSVEDQAYITAYFNDDLPDAAADEVLEVIGGGEAVLGAMFVIYSDQGDVLRVFA